MHECGRPLDATGPAETRDHLCHRDPRCCAPAGNLCPHTHLYHGDDKGQCFPTACWGRNAKVTRLVATSAYEKPIVSTLEEGGNHSCLDWKEGWKETCQVYAVIYHFTREFSWIKMSPGLDKASGNRQGPEPKNTEAR